MIRRKTRKIGFLMTLAYPLLSERKDLVHGGAEVDMVLLAKKISELPDYEVTFLTGDFGQENVTWCGPLKVQKIPFLGPHHGGGTKKILRHLFIWKMLFTCPFDIMISETATELAGWIGLIFCKLRKKAYIHRLASDRDVDLRTIREDWGAKGAWLYGRGLAHATVLIAQTASQQQSLKQLGFESHIIPNALFIQPSMPEHQKGHILWVSRGVPLKRPECFVELAKRIPDRRFIMIMPPAPVDTPEGVQANEELQGTILEKAASLQNLTILPGVPYEKIQPLFEQAAVFVNTSTYEGFPNTFLQACAAGTPILSLKVNPDGFITRYGTGEVCGDDMEIAIRFLKETRPEDLRKMGLNGWRYVKEHHDIKLIAGLYIREMDALMAKIGPKFPQE